VLDVGGDKWNQTVARRLEYEYKRNKPDLDKLVDKIIGVKAKKDPTTWEVVKHPEKGEFFAVKNNQGEYIQGAGGNPFVYFTKNNALAAAQGKLFQGDDDDTEPQHPDDEDVDIYASEPESWDDLSGDSQE
jgi:hypothetical protein